MKFRTQNHSSQMPEVNLIPMMDVIMTILTFFIIVSMTLTTGAGSVKVNLPGEGKGDNSATEKQKSGPQIIKVDAQGQLYLINPSEKTETPATLEQLEFQIQAYLQQNPKGIVLLNADRSLSYDKVIEVLMRLKKVGGDRVSLGIK